MFLGQSKDALYFMKSIYVCVEKDMIFLYVVSLMINMILSWKYLSNYVRWTQESVAEKVT